MIDKFRELSGGGDWLTDDIIGLDTAQLASKVHSMTSAQHAPVVHVFVCPRLVHGAVLQRCAVVLCCTCPHSPAATSVGLDMCHLVTMCDEHVSKLRNVTLHDELVVYVCVYTHALCVGQYCRHAATVQQMYMLWHTHLAVLSA